MLSIHSNVRASSDHLYGSELDSPEPSRTQLPSVPVTSPQYIKGGVWAARSARAKTDRPIRGGRFRLCRPPRRPRGQMPLPRRDEVCSVATGLPVDRSPWPRSITSFMQKWEYGRLLNRWGDSEDVTWRVFGTQEHYELPGRGGEMPRFFAWLGTSGWELVAAVESRGTTEYVFKRPLP